MLDFGKTFLCKGVPAVPEEQADYRQEFCAASSLHRGYYHPSPIYDLVVGNTKRGKLCRETVVNLTHRYLLDGEGELICVESLYNQRKGYTEYLLRTHTSRMGVTIDCNGCLSAVCEELFVNGRLVSVSLANFVYFSEEYHCINLLTERYDYDESGLCGCSFQNFSPNGGALIDQYYQFERKNGYLVAYESISDSQPTKGNRRYAIRKIRKA